MEFNTMRTKTSWIIGMGEGSVAKIFTLESKAVHKCKNLRAGVVKPNGGRDVPGDVVVVAEVLVEVLAVALICCCELLMLSLR